MCVSSVHRLCIFSTRNIFAFLPNLKVVVMGQRSGAALSLYIPSYPSGPKLHLLPEVHYVAPLSSAPHEIEFLQSLVVGLLKTQPSRLSYRHIGVESVKTFITVIRLSQ